jgi:hypothetical protein
MSDHEAWRALLAGGAAFLAIAGVWAALYAVRFMLLRSMCPQCEGDGVYPKGGNETCPTCHGEGLRHIDGREP